MRFSSTNVQSLTSNPIVLNAKPTGRAVFHGTVRNMSLYSNNLMALYPIQGPSIPITIGERIKVMTQISTYLDEINAPLGSFEALRQFRCELIFEELNRNDRTWLDLYLDIIREN